MDSEAVTANFPYCPRKKLERGELAQWHHLFHLRKFQQAISIALIRSCRSMKSMMQGVLG